MKLCLAIDTTGRGGDLALADAAGLRASMQHDEQQGHAESLFSLIDALLKQADASYADIERLAVVRGPGSFTGLRIGIVTAKGLAYARGLPLWSAPTLPLLAYAGGEQSTLALLAAGQEHVFAAAYCGGRSLLAPARLSLDELRALLPTLGLTACASGADAASRLLAANLGLPLLATASLGETLALCAARELWPAQASDATTLVPEYLALSQAERVHGVDFEARVHRPGPLTEWE